jgi:tetratricopeptide (TPR) repeat protein
VTGEPDGGTGNTVSGGIQYGPVLQGRDFRDVGIDVTVLAATPAPVALAQLPAPVAGFTGREEELAVLAELLIPVKAAGTVVVSAVAGLPGVGKTTLAVQAGHAARRAGWYRGGVLLIDLHGYDDHPVQPGQALDALLRALGIPAEHIPPTTDERAGLYRSTLAQVREPVLVIADNASAEAQVRPLVPGTGPHCVLVTSRHTLAGLGARLVDITVLDDDDAVALLDAALRAARPNDDRITGDAGSAQRLAKACGGLPLALQITASILKADPTLTAAELAEELAVESERLEHLRYDDGSGPAASSVAAAFELSYRRLEQLPARVFRLLPVDPGPDVSTVAAANLADLPVSEVRRVLAGLARAHLIEAAPGSVGRWRMHDLLRLYAQKLSDVHASADQRERNRGRLFAYYMDTADTADDHLQTLQAATTSGIFTAREDALTWLDAERANLVAVIKMAADTGRDEIAYRLPIALARYFSWRRRFDDWLASTRISLETARRLGDRRREAVALNNLGAALREVRRFEEAITACQDAAGVFREIGDRHGEADALNNLGSALHEVRRFDEAITAHRRDLEICKESGDRHGQAEALNNLGLALREVGRFEEAIRAHEEAVSICQETGDRHGEGSALNNLGVAIPKVWPRVNEAIVALQRAAAIFRETGDRHAEGSALDNLGVALRAANESGEAISVHEEAVSIYQETGDRYGEGRALSNLGLVLAGAYQRRDDAIVALQRAAALFRGTGDRYAEGNTLANLSGVLAQAGRLDEAMAAHKNATDIFHEIRDRHAEGSGLNRFGTALIKAGQFEKANAAHRKAAAIFRETGDRHAEGSALNNLGQGLVKVRHYNEAVAAFERATALFEETGDSSAEWAARRNADRARASRQAF